MDLHFSFKKILFYAISLIFFIGAIIYFSEIKETVLVARTIEPLWLTIAVLSQCGTYVLTALIYKRLLYRIYPKLQVSTTTLFKASIVSLSINQTLPSAGISGNVFMVEFLEKKGLAPRYSIFLILLELISFYVGIGSLLLIIMGLASIKITLPAILFILLFAGFIVYCIFLVVIIFIGKKNIISRIARKVLHTRFFSKIIKEEDFVEYDFSNMSETPWQVFTRNKLLSVQIVLLQWGIIAFDAFTIYALLYGLGFSYSPMNVLIGFLLTRILSLLPFSPGALLIFEGGMTFFYSLLGIPVYTALLATLLYRGLSFWLPIPIGLYLYRKINK